MLNKITSQKLTNDSIVSAGINSQTPDIIIGNKALFIEKFNKIKEFMFFQVDNYSGEYLPPMRENLDKLSDYLVKNLPEQVRIKDVVKILLSYYPNEKKCYELIKMLGFKDIRPNDSNSVYWGGSRIWRHLVPYTQIYALTLTIMAWPTDSKSVSENFEIFWDNLMPKLSPFQQIFFLYNINPTNIREFEPATALLSNLARKKYAFKDPVFMGLLLTLTKERLLDFTYYFGTHFIYCDYDKMDIETLWKNKKEILYLKNMMLEFSNKGLINDFHKFFTILTSRGFVAEFLKFLNPTELIHMFSGNNQSIKNQIKIDVKDELGHDNSHRWFYNNDNLWQLWNLSYDMYNHHLELQKRYQLDGLKGITVENIASIPHIVANYLLNLKDLVRTRYGEGQVDQMLEYENPENYFHGRYEELLKFLDKYGDSSKSKISKLGEVFATIRKGLTETLKLITE
ncbi:MAG: hypothetical protein PHV30_11340 [Candidatus Margulisbacteria bacterium]|nr:hypothetical protein [Candidatus Margulisiibacteriota bacterium]